MFALRPLLQVGRQAVAGCNPFTIQRADKEFLSITKITDTDVTGRFSSFPSLAHGHMYLSRSRSLAAARSDQAAIIGHPLEILGALVSQGAGDCVSADLALKGDWWSFFFLFWKR